MSARTECSGSITLVIYILITSILIDLISDMIRLRTYHEMVMFIYGLRKESYYWINL
jgi:hypothetical protein